MKYALVLVVLISLILRFPCNTMAIENKEIKEGPLKPNRNNTALVVTDPQNDFLSENGVAWPLVEKSVKNQGTIGHLVQLFQEAKKMSIPTFVSPHYYYPYDYHWEFTGELETWMHDHKMYDRTGPLSLKDFEGSGADFLPILKPYIIQNQAIITSPHKIYGPETNDLVLQLRKSGIDFVVLAGMSANLCVESHLREFLEQGFSVSVVTDATAAAQIGDLDGYEAALTNFQMIANEVLTTEEARSFFQSLNE
ncbi:cysteine hydrolase [Bacillus sp. 2205SS5-2]|uniref:cysteine hydrolase n=1 Tax=Bacillus sp. 2205SS5-2 TaxID=3109031 RepID=UPI00300626D0